MPFDTPLTPDEESRFKPWKQQYAPQDTGEDYDFRGAFKAGLKPAGPEAGKDIGHWPDTYKKPNHPTFSDQSIYSSLVGTRPGTWQGDKYIPFGKDEVFRRPTGYMEAFTTPSGSSPGYGFSNTYKPNPQAEALGKVIEALQDPRNSWIGLGPLGVLSKAAKSGGFAPGLRKMIEDVPFLKHVIKQRRLPPSTDTGALERMGFDKETAGDIMRTPYSPPHQAYVNSLEDSFIMASKLLNPRQHKSEDIANIKETIADIPEIKQEVEAMMRGITDLRGEQAMQSAPKMGGSEVPHYVLEMMKDRLGFGDQ